MAWLIAAGVVLLLAILPLGVSILYDTDGLNVRLIAGPFRVTLYPAKQKKAKPPKEAKKQPAAVGKKSQSSKETKKGGSLQDFLPLLSTVLDFLSTFRRKLRVQNLQLRLIMAADDPCDLAVNYGKAWTAIGNLMPQLERLFVIKNRDVEVECDFTSDKTLIKARLDLTITLCRLLSVAAVHGIRILRQFLTIMKTRKGGAKT